MTDTLSRPYGVNCPAGIGLRLEDGNKIVGQIQKAVLGNQVEKTIRESRICPTCASVRAIHDDRKLDLEHVALN